MRLWKHCALLFQYTDTQKNDQHPSHHHPCMYASLYASYLIHILLTWVLLFQLILFLKSSTAEPEGSLSPPFYSPHSRSLAMVTRRQVRCGVVRVIISFAAFRDALLHFNSSPIYFANPSYLWVNVYGAKCRLSPLGCFLSFPRPCLTARETESLMSGNIKLISVQEENLLFSYRELYFWKFLTIEATLHCWAEGCNYQQELWVAIEWGDSPKRGGHLDEMLIVICVPGGMSPWQYLLPSLDFVLVHMCLKDWPLAWASLFQRVV